MLFLKPAMRLTRPYAILAIHKSWSDMIQNNTNIMTCKSIHFTDEKGWLLYSCLLFLPSFLMSLLCRKQRLTSLLYLTSTHASTSLPGWHYIFRCFTVASPHSIFTSAPPPYPRHFSSSILANTLQTFSIQLLFYFYP